MGQSPGRSRIVVVAAVVTTLTLIASPGAAWAGQPSQANEAMWSSHPSGLQVHVGEYRQFGTVSEDLRPALGAAEQLVERMPADFARPWIDKASGTVMIDVATGRGTALLDAIRDRAPNALAIAPELALADDGPLKDKPADLGSIADTIIEGKALQRTVRLSAADMLRIEDGLIELSTLKEFDAENIWMTRADPPSNRVIVTVDSLSDGLAERIVERFGTTDVAVEIDKDEVPMPLAAGGRQTDWSPHYGGATIYAGTSYTSPNMQCTDAFSWVSGSQAMMLTAGHCIPGGGYIKTPWHGTNAYMGTVTVSSRENWSNSVGSTYLSGQSVYRGDMALAQVTSGTSSGRIYRGSASSSSNAGVLGMMSSSSQAGDQFCTGGANPSGPGEICGWTVDVVGASFEYESGHWFRNVVRSESKQGWCNRPGDSGGSVYVVSGSSVYAKGILNAAGGGGSDYWGGYWDQCSVSFTDIYQPFYGFPGVIKTG